MGFRVRELCRKWLYLLTQAILLHPEEYSWDVSIECRVDMQSILSHHVQDFLRGLLSCQILTKYQLGIRRRSENLSIAGNQNLIYFCLESVNKITRKVLTLKQIEISTREHLGTPLYDVRPETIPPFLLIDTVCSTHVHSHSKFCMKHKVWSNSLHQLNFCKRRIRIEGLAWLIKYDPCSCQGVCLRHGKSCRRQSARTPAVVLWSHHHCELPPRSEVPASGAVLPEVTSEVFVFGKFLTDFDESSSCLDNRLKYFTNQQKSSQAIWIPKKVRTVVSISATRAASRPFATPVPVSATYMLCCYDLVQQGHDSWLRSVCRAGIT